MNKEAVLLKVGPSQQAFFQAASAPGSLLLEGKSLPIAGTGVAAFSFPAA